MSELAKLNFKLGIFMLIGAAVICGCTMSDERERSLGEATATGALIGGTVTLGILSVEKALLL